MTTYTVQVHGMSIGLQGAFMAKAVETQAQGYPEDAFLLFLRAFFSFFAEFGVAFPLPGLSSIGTSSPSASGGVDFFFLVDFAVLSSTLSP